MRARAGSLVVLLLAACGPTSPEPSPTAPAAVDQVLRLPYVETTSLDPIDYTIENGTIRLLVSGLTGLDEDLNTVPAIAESWDVTDNGQRITFHLRDASYSNGEPIVADDFVYAWRRLLDPRRSAQLDLGYLLADVVGAADLLAIPEDDVPVDEEIEALLAGLGVSAPDSRTLEVELIRPASYFVAVVSGAATAPVPEAWITQPGATEGGAYVSSGPWVLSEWVHEERRTLKPNPLWWGEPSRLTRIEMRTFASDAEALDAYRSGELDILYLAEGIQQASDLADQARPLPGSQFWYIPFDRIKEGSPTAASADLRRALSLAVDRDAVNALVQWDGPVAGSLIPPGMPGHDPSLESVYDPDAARDLLDRALDELGLGSAAELDLSMMVAEFTETTPAGADFVVEQWRTILGVEVDAVVLDVEAWFEQLGQHEHDLEWNGWFPDYPHPQNYLEPTFGCTLGNLNLYGYCNPDFDELLDRATRTGDVDEQVALYAEAQRLIVDDPVGIFLAWPGGQALVAPRVEGLVLTPMDDVGYPGGLFFTRVSITGQD